MNIEHNKFFTLSALLGAIGMNIGIGISTAFEVEVAPPVVTLPIMVTNVAWAMMFFFLIKNDIRLGYLGAIAVGISTFLLPVMIFFSVFGPGPEIRPTHFIGVPSDIAFGIILVRTGFRGWRSFSENVNQSTTKSLSELRRG